MAIVGIVLGSDSDLPAMRPAAQLLESFAIAYEVVIASAHRAPEAATDYAATAAERGLDVLIAAAGMAAHLPGVLAAFTPLPVIGVPMASPPLGGLDALYSIVQMPPGVPVATVAINGAKNAALLAAQIIGVKDPQVRQQVIDFKKNQEQEIKDKAELLQRLGIDGYLAQR